MSSLNCDALEDIFPNEEFSKHTFCERALLNTFQKRRVSSPAPVTIASPSGDMAK